MTKRKSTEAFTQLMADGVDGADITLDTSAKVITRDDNKKNCRSFR